MPTMVPLDETEAQRIEAILTSTRSGDWESFKKCSDNEFPNEKSMKEQFDKSHKYFGSNFNWRMKCAVAAQKDGSRIIHMLLDGIEEESPKFDLEIHSKKNGHGSFQMTVWVFARRRFSPNLPRSGV